MFTVYLTFFEMINGIHATQLQRYDLKQIKKRTLGLVRPKDVYPLETGYAEAKLGSQKAFSGTYCILKHERFRIDLPYFA